MYHRNNERIKIGVAGAGKMGANHIRALAELNGAFELVGVYDPVPEKARVAERYGVTAYRTYEDMLRDVDAVSLPCPTSLHRKMATIAAEHGKHAFVEKPIAETKEDAEAMYEAFSKKGLILCVGHIERFNPVVTILPEIIKNMEIISVEAHRCSPYDPRIFDVDVVSDLMIHDLDIVINAICNEEPKTIHGIGKKVYSTKFVDYAQASLVFPAGPVAFITSSRCTEDKIRTICIHTTEAYIEGDLLRRTLTIKRGVHLEDRKSAQDIHYQQSSIIEQIAVPNEEPLKGELKEFFNAIQEGKKPRISESQVIRTMTVLDSVKSSIYGEWGGT